MVILILDAEGVVFDAEYLPKLAAARSETAGAEVDRITRDGIQGRIDWEDGLRARINALRGTPYETCARMAEDMPLTPGIVDVCRAVKREGWRIVVVSGGFTMMFPDELRRKLEIDEVFANHLVFDEHGRLDGVRMDVGADKAAAVRKALPDVPPERMACIVDGANDLSLMRMCKLGLAYASTCDELKRQADVILEYGKIHAAPGIIMERMRFVDGPVNTTVIAPGLGVRPITTAAPAPAHTSGAAGFQ